MIDNPGIECVVMGKHGLVTWGANAKEAYNNVIRIVQEAEDYLNDKKAGQARFWRSESASGG